MKKDRVANWTILWPEGAGIRAISKDGGQTGVGRFIIEHHHMVVVELWFAGDTFKVEHDLNWTIVSDERNKRIVIRGPRQN